MFWRAVLALDQGSKRVEPYGSAVSSASWRVSFM
jgi:hypothetical protein